MSKQAAHFWFEWIRTSLEEGKEVELTANGWSMWPMIQPGTVLTLIKIPIDEIQVGDAIAFIRNEHFVVHRVEKIVAQQPRQISTRGDANLRCDEMITTENYGGKVRNEFSKKAPRPRQRIFNYLHQLLQISWARAKKIPSLLKRDTIWKQIIYLILDLELNFL